MTISERVLIHLKAIDFGAAAPFVEELVLSLSARRNLEYKLKSLPELCGSL
jgi:hypothetical protein